MKSKGLPGLRGTDHIGFTVPNLEEAIDFLVNVLGCEPFYELGPFLSDGDWMAEQLNVPAKTVMRRLKFLRCGNGVNFEVFEYEISDQNLNLPRNCDIGGHHVAFYVDDFDMAFAYLRERGVKILGKPVVRTEGPGAGQTWVYFLAPWGMQFELVSYPNGKKYETDFDRKLWKPPSPEIT